MAARFKLLKSALKFLAKPNDEDADTTAVVLNKDSVLGRYQAYVKGENRPEYTRDANSKPGKINKVKLFPFRYAAGAGRTEGNDSILVPISKRAFDNADIAPVKAQCNISDSLAGARDASFGFQPAKATIRRLGAPNTDPETSQITGRRYYGRNATSWTLPFGAKTGELSPDEVKGGIVLAVAALTGTFQVNFKDERT